MQIHTREDIMTKRLHRVLSFLSALSLDTHLWCASVIGGAILLVTSFFVNPIDKIVLLNAKIVNAQEQSIEVVHNQMNYSSILGASSETVREAIESDSNVAVGDDSSSSVSLNDGTVVSVEDFDSLCRIIQCEATGQDVKGRILVANVVLNRTKCDIFPDSIQEVVESPGQFEPVTRKSYYVSHPDSITKEAAMRALNGEDYSQGALYFQRSTCEVWGDKTYLFRYNGHSFYK